MPIEDHEAITVSWLQRLDQIPTAIPRESAT